MVRTRLWKLECKANLIAALRGNLKPQNPNLNQIHMQLRNLEFERNHLSLFVSKDKWLFFQILQIS